MSGNRINEQARAYLAEQDRLREAEAEKKAERAARLEAELVVLEAIKREGCYWPGG